MSGATTNPETAVLELCHATIVAPPTMMVTLETLVRKVGFAAHDTIHGRAGSLAPGAIPYFLVDYRLGDAALGPFLKTIRAHPDDSLRFAPVVLIVRDGPFDAVLGFLRQGFDDVVALPEKRDILADRLATQIRQDHLYIETADYLGPDRRRFDMPPAGVEQRQGLKPYTRLTVRRQPGKGISVVRREFIAPLGSDTAGRRTARA